MSTVNAASSPVTATLIRGRYHDVMGQVWNRDNPESLTQVVSPEVEDRLREHAVEITHVEGQEYRRPRFAFSNDTPNATKFAPMTARAPRRGVASAA